MHAGFERHPGACAGQFEDHGGGLADQRLMQYACSLQTLEFVRSIEDLPELFYGKTRQGQEITFAHVTRD